ncbi:magnesium transporter MgtE [Methanoplanus sp. FWC-SCC4]|uniref:Magnesium transporter MgtE n=2 Tax=Methanochimaera problematica TaxID=2609417 RepID=A0AA97FEX7_9EURY|nr:magnesium transporter MgtE [Methanoplanus sp. FWC-SCC4]
MMKFPVVDVHQLHLFLIGLLALLISAFAASVAGIYLGSVGEILAYLPGLMVIVPPSINMRGSISGVLASRLSSSMHLGEFEINFSKDSILGSNTRASLSISIIIAFVLGFFAYLLSSAFGLEGLYISDFIVISVISGIISSIIVMGVTLVITLLSYKKSIDLDMIAAPSVTTSGDLVTLPVLIITAVAILNCPVIIRDVLLILVIMMLIFSIYVSLRSNEEIKSISREIIPLLIPLCLVGTFAGITYATDLEKLVAYSVFLILIPPFTGCCGSIGGILCSRLATGMHTGEIDPKMLPSKDVSEYFISTYIYAIIIMPLLGIIADISASALGMSTPGILSMFLVSTAAGLLVITFVNIVGYATASISFRKGFDPDNFGIPVITSFIDLIGAGVLVAFINLII